MATDDEMTLARARKEVARLQERLKAAETQLAKDREDLWKSGRDAERTVLLLALNAEIAKLERSEIRFIDPTSKGRLHSLLFVRDSILDPKETD